MPQPKTLSQLIAEWATNPCVERKCGNLRTDAQGRLWSYAMPIARPSGHIMLITNQRRSVTTSRHTNLAKRAAMDAGWTLSDQDLGGERP